MWEVRTVPRNALRNDMIVGKRDVWRVLGLKLTSFVVFQVRSTAPPLWRICVGKRFVQAFHFDFKLYMGVLDLASN